jgi:hypothetical protein
VFQAAGFDPAQEVTVPDGRRIERDIDDLVAYVLSISSTAPHLFGDRLDAFERDLRAVLAAASPSGLFSVVLPDNTPARVAVRHQIRFVGRPMQVVDRLGSR